MTEQQGSDAQLTDEQRAEIDRRYELALAEAVEEERKTEAAPSAGDG